MPQETVALHDDEYRQRVLGHSRPVAVLAAEEWAAKLPTRPLPPPVAPLPIPPPIAAPVITAGPRQQRR